MTPAERKKQGLRKICYCCLGPYHKCKSKCANFNYVKSAKLFCKECKDWADQNDKCPSNILLCRNKKHTKPDNNTLVSNLKKFWKDFNPGNNQAKVMLSAHLQMVALAEKCTKCKKKCKCKPKLLTGKPNPEAKVPIVNTYTGEQQDDIPDDLIIKESTEDAFYVMQILNVKGKDMLVFFDRGANINLVDGELANDLDLKVMSRKTATIGGIGGTNSISNYGTYGLSLGPDEDGLYHEITAQGFQNLTSEFPKYDLKSINKEVRENKLLHKKAKLPEYIGGQRASLLLGIKNTALEPILIASLPGGLGIYKSPFMDKFGSRYCFGGPHSAFTSINNTAKFNHVNAFFIQSCNNFRESLFPSLSRRLEPAYLDGDYGVMFLNDQPVKPLFSADKEDYLPTAISSKDVEDLGLSVEDESTRKESTNDEDVCICSPLDDPKPCSATNAAVHKAKISVAKRKDYVDEEDLLFANGFRCEDCSRCKKCSTSNRTKMMSIQEKNEQEAIQKSVTVCLEENKVYVDLPFTKPPVEALKKKHHGKDNNYYQALRIFQGQCRKPEAMKKEMVKVHQDLVDRGFMKKLCHLSPEDQNIIKNAGFKHYMPWQTAEKHDSLSTPYRMVVNASITGLNEILAKGENHMTRINDVLIRNRCRKYIWTSDISKLYNQLRLKKSALPYGLFLFNNSLDPNSEPEVYVMQVAWYGVTSTGNQSKEALEQVAKLLNEQYPEAEKIINQDCYVDDVLTGSCSEETVDAQIKETKEVLSQGGFTLKYCVKSGEPPSQDASADGKSLKILGYKWSPQEDVLNPGFSQLNFNKKRRGAKQANPFPVVSRSDVTKLLESTNITRRMVVSKIAEIWDPVGLWEPYKLQLKLESHHLNGYDWDVALEPDLQRQWTERFQEFLDVPNMCAPRCIIPSDAENPNEIRLLCISDAAELAGGCAIYGCYKRTNGQYSCGLLTARSKLLGNKVPRNELEGIKLMAETAVAVKNALGSKVVETLFFTDSTIAMCWVHNQAKKLRMYTLYRVADIRRAIKEASPNATDDDLPLFHIDGKLNVADLLTKPNSILPQDIGTDSTWQSGLPWMTKPLAEMPLTTYQDLTISSKEEDIIDAECFPEPILSQVPAAGVHLVQELSLKNPHCHGCKPRELFSSLDKCYGCQDQFDHCDNCKCTVKLSSFSSVVGRGSILIDIIKFGWLISLIKLSVIIRAKNKFVHLLHVKRGKPVENCYLCKSPPSEYFEYEIKKRTMLEAKDYLFRKESERLKTMLPPKKIASFIEKDGILYHEGRLIEENPVTVKDLDFDVFFDNTEIKSMLPVVSADSEIFFAYAIYIHEKIRVHCGVELTLREISKSMMVINNPRRIIQRVRRDCTRCRAIAKMTVELRMSHHPAARTQLAPPFYHCQMDTVYGFKGQPHKNARKTVKVYALVIVCLLTGATSILALEGLETQDVIQAIERHSARHGVPAVVYVDNGTQLTALDRAEFSLRDVKAHVYDSLGLEVCVSTAKSHEARGRVESKVKILRSMLQKLAINTDHAMSALQWETLFAKIGNLIDDVPLAKSKSSNVNDPGWEIITANRLKLGRNNNRALEGSFDVQSGKGITAALLKRNQDIQKVWYQMLLDRIHHLIPRPDKWNKTDSLHVGDICLFTYTENSAMGKDVWKLGTIVDLPSKNKVVIEFTSNFTGGKYGLPKLKTIVRSPRNISIISSAEEIALNSREYYEQLVKDEQKGETVKNQRSK